MNSSHRVTAIPSRSLSLRLFLWNLESDIWKRMEGYGEKGNILRWKLERSFPRNCFVFCEFISQNYSIPPRSRSLRQFLWNLQRDFWKPIGAYGEKESNLRWKLQRWFLRNCFVMCDFHSLSYSCISWSCLLALFLLISENYYFGSLWRQRDKGTKEIPKINTGKKLSEKLLCDTWLPLTELLLYFLERFASLISVESENCYFGSLWRL